MKGQRTMRFVIMAFLGAAIWGASGHQTASADSFPNRPIRVIVGYAPGGPSNSGARLMSEPLSQQLGQPVVIINQPGGGGLNSTNSYASYPPDGYTLLLGAIGPLTIIPAFENVNYDPIRGFVPLGLVWTSALTLVVSPKLGITSLKEFVAYAKGNPGKVTIASAGIGSVTHLAIALFMYEAHINLNHVPYHSTSESLPALMGGQIDALFGDTPILTPQINAGKVVALAVTATKRQPSIPNVPTMAELGQPNVVAASWFGFVVSSKTPKPVVKRLQDAMSAAQKDPVYLAKLAKGGASFGEAGPAAYGDLIKSDAVKWRTVIKEAGIKLK